MDLIAKKMELRGVVNKTSNKGKVYQMLNVEDESTDSYSFYVSDVRIIPQGLKKGDLLTLTFDLFMYGGKYELKLVGIQKES